VRAGAVRFDFAAFIAHRRHEFFTEDHGLADVFKRPSVLFQKLVDRQTMSIHASSSFSILFRQKQSRVGARRLGDDPHAVSRVGSVAAQEPEALLQRGRLDVHGSAAHSLAAVMAASQPLHLVPLSSYRVDGLTGLLTFLGTTPLGDNNYAFSLATDPEHKFLYTANLDSSSISGFAIDPAADTLSALAGSPFSANLPWALAIHPSSKFLYVARGPGSPLTYSLDGSGVPTYLARTPPENGGDIAVTVAPSGNFVYTANVNANTVSFYSVDANSGAGFHRTESGLCDDGSCWQVPVCGKRKRTVRLRLLR
jgi:hypothetical protein